MQHHKTVENKRMFITIVAVCFSLGDPFWRRNLTIPSLPPPGCEPGTNLYFDWLITSRGTKIPTWSRVRWAKPSY